MVAVLALLVVLGSALGDWCFTPAVFSGFASVVIWWIATGLDGWARGGGGSANTIASLGDPAKAGAGAFSGVLSTPVEWVFLSIAWTLVFGVVLGRVSIALAGALSAVVGSKARETVAA